MKYLGLSETEARERLKKFGFNELPASEHQGILQILLRVVQEPMLLLLLSCGFIYLLTGEVRDGLLLFTSAIVVVSITLYQEVRSTRALEALRNLSSPRALVVRDEKTRRIPGREVVPGDLIQISEGDRIPADAVLISSTHLSVDESLLTGESFSVTKIADESFLADATQVVSRNHRLFSGTLVVGGQGLAVVIATGLKTELGKIGRSIKAAPETATPLQNEVNRIIRAFGLLGIIFSIAIAMIYGITRGDWPKGILAGLASAMALLPEEFPVVMTVFMAMGAWRISRKNVLTRRVTAIEALGSISALCVDKTGTLTQNRMSVCEVLTPNENVELGKTKAIGPQVSELLKIAILACNENPFDPMEKAILVTTPLTSLDQKSENRRRVIQYPHSSGLMAMSCVWKIKEQAQLLVAAKGAPEAILELCHFGRKEKKEVLAQVQKFASRGLRILAVAQAEYPDNDLPEHQHEFEFRYLGLLALEDPIRPEVPAAIEECQNAGIRVIMLTGDYPETARSIAKQLRLPEDTVASGPDLSRIDDLKLQQIVRTTSVFARVTPEQKLRIVTTLKAIGERVAMTGDGVNDAPSLKWADIGVAMGGRGTDVAREAASIVLLDDNFTSMVSAIRLGRRIYDNLQKAVFFILAIHIPIAGLAMLPVLLGWPLLLLPAHIVFLELIIDPACSLVYEAEEEESDVMKRKPRNTGTPLVRLKDLLITGAQGGVILILVLAVYGLMLREQHSVVEARTTAFLALILSNLGLILVNRAHRGSILGTLKKKNFAFEGVVVGTLVLLVLILSIEPIRLLFGFGLPHYADLGVAIGVGILSLITNNGIRWFSIQSNTGK